MRRLIVHRLVNVCVPRVEVVVIECDGRGQARGMALQDLVICKPLMRVQRH